MAGIPPNLARVPNVLATQLQLSSLTRTGVAMLRVNEQLTTGRLINRTSDDAVRSSVALVLDERIEQTSQRLRNFSHAETTLATVDQSLADARDLALEGRTIASSQVGVGSDATTRANQAVVVQSLIQEMVSVANRRFTDIHLFGGSTPGEAPIRAFLGGYRYVGRGDGLRTDLGEGIDAPITLGADQAFGALSARVRGEVDLNPTLTLGTAVADLRGARNLGVTLGSVRVTIDNGAPVAITVDLSEAQTVGDVRDRIESAVRAQDPAAFAAGFPATGLAGERLNLSNIAAGYSITFTDVGGGSTAADLGLAGFTFNAGAPNNPAGDLDPRLTDFTRIADLGANPPIVPGDIRFRNGTAQGTVTVTAGMTVAEFKAAVAGLNLGIRAEIGADARTLDVINEVSGLRMAVEEAGSTTATTLGIRSLSATMDPRLFNDGRGVQIADGAIHPVTGLPDAARNLDFRVTLSDGTAFDVDLVPGDLASVQGILDRINTAAGALFPGSFTASLSSNGNGVVLRDTLGGAGQVRVTSLNGYAAEDLGLLDGASTGGNPAVLAGSDRATVRVDSVFSTLIELRASLETNNERGITFAGERLTDDADRLTRARGLAGARASRVEAARLREEDINLLNEKIRGELIGLDYTEAATRFNLLQIAQQAGLAATARSQSLSLLDFLR